MTGRHVTVPRSCKDIPVRVLQLPLPLLLPILPRPRVLVAPRKEQSALTVRLVPLPCAFVPPPTDVPERNAS